MCNDNTGHAEAVEIIFDPKRLSYDRLLDLFFANHDPTTLNRQGADVGPQYRSAILVHDENQNKLAQNKIAELESSDSFIEPIVTQIIPASEFWPAEDYHQRYYEKKGIVPQCDLR